MMELPESFEPARINEDLRVCAPRCHGERMLDDGGCLEGCCDDYKCAECEFTIRIEWPD